GLRPGRWNVSRAANHRSRGPGGTVLFDFQHIPGGAAERKILIRGEIAAPRGRSSDAAAGRVVAPGFSAGTPRGLDERAVRDRAGDPGAADIPGAIPAP